MRVCIDVCVSQVLELELWRAGYRVPVRAQAGEDDWKWLCRARQAGCTVVITRDKGAANVARGMGMVSVFIQHTVNAEEMPQAVLDAMEQVEDRFGHSEPIVAVG